MKQENLFTLLVSALCCITIVPNVVRSNREWPSPAITAECAFRSNCPLPLSIHPCTCIKTPSKDVRIICFNFTSVSDMVAAVRNMGGFCIDTLTIASSDIGYLPSNMFLGVRIREIQIRDTHLTHFTEAGESAFLGLEKSLQYLSLRRCGLLTPLKWDRLGDLVALMSLDLTGNLLEEVREEWFNKPPSNLQLVYLRKNNISVIEDKAFASFLRLTLLDLSENSISEITRTMFPLDAKYLTYLYLSYNKISSLPDDIFTGMRSLRRLYLDFNHIQVLSDEAFRPVWGHLEYLDLMGNRMLCDCSMMWMTKVLTMPRWYYGHCDLPPALRHRPLANLWPWDIEDSSSVVCNVTSKFTPQGRTSYDKWFSVYRKSAFTKYNGRRPMQMHHKALRKEKYSEHPDNEVYLG